jgi:DNA-binding HxlR family transcriptional regulator
MAGSTRYRQYCPIALTAEIVSERWTPLVLRGLFCGATRFNDLQRSVPRMSPSLLSRRLKELEGAGIVARSADGPAVTYRLTRAGSELFPILEQMGAWAQHHLRREVTQDENLDPDVLMWEIRHRILEDRPDGGASRVVRFQLSGVPVAKRFYWLVFGAEDVEVCIRDPGYPVDLFVEAHLRDLVAVWMGHVSLARAVEDGRLRLDGPAGERDRLSRWLKLSPMAKFAVEETSG